MASFLTKVEGFTPIMDVVVQDVGLMPALIYGVTWRFCQRRNKVCNASLDTIAKTVGVSRKTVERHIKDLCDKGYLEDTTPDVLHSPHVYIDTGKARIEGLLTVRRGATESPTDDSGKTESPTGSDTESDLGKTESPTKILLEDSKEEDTCGTASSGGKESKEERLERLRDKFGKDPTEMAMRAAQLLDDNGDRPKGWRDATESEFAICKRVAELWAGGALPWATDDIEKHLTAAHHLLKLVQGNQRKLIRAIDSYHAENGESGLSITGPYSLRNVLPPFLKDLDDDGNKVLRIGM